MQVTSMEMAEAFNKQHKTIIEVIENYTLKYYGDKDIDKIERKSGSFYYLLSERARDFTALNLKGERADTYRRMLVEQSEDIYSMKFLMAANDTKEQSNKLTDSIRDNIVKYRIEVEKKQNDGRYYQHYTNLIYKKLGIDLPKAVNPRDVLDKRTLVKLEDLEDKVADMIREYAENGTYYKDALKLIKERIS